MEDEWEDLQCLAEVLEAPYTEDVHEEVMEAIDHCKDAVRNMLDWF